MRKRFGAALASLLLLVACGRADEPVAISMDCHTERLACASEGSGCPDMDAAIATICRNFSQSGWVATPNECGGVNISNPPNLSGAVYAFDAAGRLVGMGSGTDIADAEGCNGHSSGRICNNKKDAVSMEHSCTSP